MGEKWVIAQKKWVLARFLEKKWAVKLVKNGPKMVKNSPFWVILHNILSKIEVFESYRPFTHFFFLFNREKVYFIYK